MCSVRHYRLGGGGGREKMHSLNVFINIFVSAKFPGAKSLNYSGMIGK